MKQLWPVALVFFVMALALGSQASKQVLGTTARDAREPSATREASERVTVDAPTGPRDDKTSATEKLAVAVREAMAERADELLGAVPSSPAGEDWGRSVYAAVLARPAPRDPRPQADDAQHPKPDTALELEGAARARQASLSVRTRQIGEVYERLYAATEAFPEPHRTRRIDYLLHRIAGHDELPDDEATDEEVSSREARRLTRILSEERIP